jgi:hypothetical protein
VKGIFLAFFPTTSLLHIFLDLEVQNRIRKHIYSFEANLVSGTSPKQRMPAFWLDHPEQDVEAP